MDERDCTSYSLFVLQIYSLLFPDSLCALKSDPYGMYHPSSLSSVFQLSLASKCWQDCGGQKWKRRSLSTPSLHCHGLGSGCISLQQQHMLVRVDPLSSLCFMGSGNSGPFPCSFSPWGGSSFLRLLVSGYVTYPLLSF